MGENTMIITSKTVRELSLEAPQAIRVFERLGIDYCCHGERLLEEACALAHVEVEDVERSLAEADERPAEPGQNDVSWQRAPLFGLIAHIVQKHHYFVRRELRRIEPLLARVIASHGPKHPELLEVQRQFRALGDEMVQHMMKEEHILFPYISQLEESEGRRQPAAPPPFGTVQNPIRMMMQEHENAGSALRAIRAQTSDYRLPDGACAGYETLFNSLQDFEQDLHQHIHLENNILFPRALKLEEKSRSGGGWSQAD
jgi:regulator of cell morphogenesis and NO signaling